MKFFCKNFNDVKNAKSLNVAKVLKICLLGCGVFLFTSCESLSGEHLSVPYIVLLWLGVVAGYTLSCLVWASDNPGHKYTPWWEVGAWFFFTFFGAFLAYTKYFFLFSGFLIALATPTLAMTVVMLIVKVIRKRLTEH